MAAMLFQVGFEQKASNYYRQVGDIQIRAFFEKRGTDQTLVFSLTPNIIHMQGHQVVALGASVLFKVADRIAERFESSLIHDSNIGECKEERGGAQGLLAAYPEIPFTHANLCLGFRNALGGITE